MIIIQARIPVLADRRNTAYERIHEFVDAARGEDGCLHCEALVSLENPDLIVLHQTWRDEDALRRHAEGAPLDTFLDALPQFIDGQVSTIRYEAVVEDDVVVDDEPDAAGAPQGVTLH